MARTYEWSRRIADLIEALPAWGSADFWLALEDGGSRTALPAEVLAYVVRAAYARDERSLAERAFALLWARHASHVIYYARDYRMRLQRSVTAEDVAVDVFATLATRLRGATGVTFYECCFLPGLKRLTLDKVQRMEDEPLVSLTVEREDGEEEHDVQDQAAVDPFEHVEVLEEREELRAALPAYLIDLPERAQRTALGLMHGQTESQIAAALGVSTRMVTNYKAAIRRVLADLEGG